MSKLGTIITSKAICMLLANALLCITEVALLLLDQRVTSNTATGIHAFSNCRMLAVKL